MLVEVQQLEVAMRELLAMLADSSGEGAAAAWVRCDAAQTKLDALLADTTLLSTEEQAELRVGLENLVRLNAITRQAVRHNQDGLAQSLVKAKRENAKMKAYAAGSQGLGGSCDLAG